MIRSANGDDRCGHATDIIPLPSREGAGGGWRARRGFRTQSARSAAVAHAIALMLAAMLMPLPRARGEEPPAPPPPATRLSPDQLRESVTQLLSAKREELKIPGLSAAVVLDGKVAFTVAMGLADAEYNVPVTERTVYRIGGISKSLTAVAVLQLVQDGKLSLDASLRDYVPEYPNKGETITIRQALAHLSGVRREKDREEFLTRKKYPDLLTSIEPFAKDPLVAKPGERFIFSNYNYTLLGLAVERVASMRFAEYMRKNVCDPLGMAATGLDDPEAVVPARARGYVQADGGLRHAAFVDLAGRAPGSGLVSTADDLAKFAVAVLDGRVLNEELRRDMLTSGKTADGKDTGYGLGWFVRQDGGHRIVGHSGPEVGFSSFLVVYPDDKAAVVVLCNLERTNVGKIALEIGRLALGIAAVPPAAAAEEP